MSTVETKISVPQGGTGAATAGDARTALDVPQDPVAVASGGTGLTAVGTGNQVLATNAGATAMEWQDVSSGITMTMGSTSRDLSDASNTQNITHGLGTTPGFVKFDCVWWPSGGNSASGTCVGVYNGTNQHSLYASKAYTAGVVTSRALTLYWAESGHWQYGVVSVSSTQITIVWTKNGSASGRYDILWQAYV